ncbi:MAG TPA: flavodoxin domain-containing protein [Mycobacteriales bacterium]|jgi:menaquinone-dependent protoporphyrinogen oxidase|nr:flavodoxin domain-containing protein [Mycobacteriales bacterium]
MRILVSAASRHGSTAEIATELGKALRGALPGAGVDVVPLSRVSGVEQYDAVVLGSAVYFGRWLEEARWQVTAQSKILRERPVWLFSSGPVGDPAVPATEAVDAAELAATIGAREHVVFPGALHRELLGMRERLAVGLVHAADGDYRDWPAVRAWADRIAADLRIRSGIR